MDKKIIFSTILFSFVTLVLGYVLIGSLDKKNQINGENTSSKISLPAKDKIIFYYGITCPHCREVEEWMEKNKIEEKIKIEKKEVYENQNNFQELNEVVKACGLDNSTIGVPFLYFYGKCYTGTTDIEKILTEKIKLKEKQHVN